MSEITQAEQYLLDQIRQGDSQAWTQVVERYQGRLVMFAISKLPQKADADDIVQDTFLAFLKGLNDFRGEASLETYLFTILRRKIINTYRSRQSARVCLLQDVIKYPQEDSHGSDPFQTIAAADLTASGYARRDEGRRQSETAFTDVLREMVNGMKNSQNFRDLKIIECILYCQLPNKKIAQLINISDRNIAVIKHRIFKQIQGKISHQAYRPDLESPGMETFISEIWERQRLSCLKRSTIGAFLLQTLDDPWADYARFHLHTLGCNFCQANMVDLQEQTRESENSRLRHRIMESTVGFLHKR